MPSTALSGKAWCLNCRRDPLFVLKRKIVESPPSHRLYQTVSDSVVKHYPHLIDQLAKDLVFRSKKIGQAVTMHMHRRKCTSGHCFRRFYPSPPNRSRSCEQSVRLTCIVLSQRIRNGSIYLAASVGSQKRRSQPKGGFLAFRSE